MKIFFKKLTAITCAIACGMVLLINAACAEDEPLPPEVKKLIGMKLPPKIINASSAKIPGFIEVNGAIIFDLGERADSVIAYSEGVLNGGMTIFFVERIYHPDRAMEILDARLLPSALLDWRLENGAPTSGRGHYRLSSHCRANKSDSRIIFGLVRPEQEKEDCAHFSKQIKQAWQLNMDSNRLAPIQSQGLECEYITMDSCY